MKRLICKGMIRKFKYEMISYVAVKEITYIDFALKNKLNKCALFQDLFDIFI